MLGRYYGSGYCSIGNWNMNMSRYDFAQLLAAIEGQPRGPANSDVTDAAERQMQRWLDTHKGQATAALAPITGKLACSGPYLTISRETGVGGSQIARLVGQATGWEVFERELLECLAERYHTLTAVWNSWMKAPRLQSRKPSANGSMARPLLRCRM